MKMEKEDIEKLEEVNQRSKSNTKRIDDHDKKISRLEDVYIALTKMDNKIVNVETDIGEIKSDIKLINTKANEPNKEKALKWDKLIDYMFYAILAYALYRLGLK